MEKNEIINYHFNVEDSQAKPDAHIKVWMWLMDNRENIKKGIITYGNYFDKCKEEDVRVRFSTLQFYQSFGLICRMWVCEM